MAYTDLFEALLMVIYLLKDEEGMAKSREVTEQLYQRGLLTSFADDDVSFSALVDSDDYKPYIKRGYVEAGTQTADGDIVEEGYALLGLTEEGLEKAKELNAARYSTPQSLFTWGFMSGFDSKLEILANMALSENWREGDQPYGILRAYITNTFKRLLHMRKSGNRYAIVEGTKWAAFNTGLVDKLYDPIYALFAANKKEGMQKWVFNSWCTPGNRRPGQILSRAFETLPVKATYFDKPSDLVYDINAGLPTLPFEHILDRLERLPLSYLKSIIPTGFEWPEEPFTPDKEFYDAYREALDNDDFARLRFKDGLELSLRRAIKKVGWNYRMVIPVYDAKRRRMMQLIPMSLDFENINNIQFALMVERATVSGKYIGHTILTPGMAYRKARMVMTQEADWLSPQLLDSENTLAVKSDEDVELESEIKESDANASAALSLEKAREEAQNKEAEQDNARLGFMTLHDNDEIYRPELENVPKVLDKIDVSKYDKSFLFRAGEEHEYEEEKENRPIEHTVARYEKKIEPVEFSEGYIPNRDYDIPGIYKSNYGKPYILVGRYRYQAREFTDEDLLDGDDVLFDIRTEPNLKNTGIFRFAVNIRLADEYSFEND
ncbi:MAG: DUF3825 domain-containing protein [Muribaculaceae bacterium]|nr:DUF3825 domain-containing protein [Muribaculaceae bacterium]